jgi:pyruvate kinase
MIDKANFYGKPIITATQMLESMTSNRRPTRAEVTDVANAVLDGTDCVMLSGETAGGKFPVEAVKIMSEICIEAESCFNHKNYIYMMMKHSQKHQKQILNYLSLCSSAVKTAYEIRANAIIVITKTGLLTRSIAKYRPSMPIFSFW